MIIVVVTSHSNIVSLETTDKEQYAKSNLEKDVSVSSERKRDRNRGNCPLEG